MTSGRNYSGFSLIELLVVVAIISMLTGIILPSMSRAKQLARRVQCINNVRLMVLAASQYTVLNDGSFPLAKYQPGPDDEKYTYVSWDFSYRKDGKIVPGLLWSDDQDMAVQQCPSYAGPAKWAGDRFTGYNYNTSYIGHGQWEAVFAPARADQVKDPSNCALFGDGQYASGANKYMRSPFKAPGDKFPSRCAGTQGFRHLGTTCVGFCDGHVVPLAKRYFETSDLSPSFGKETGFLSSDNDLYDLE